VKVGVCLKQVPASDARITISDPSKGIDTSEVKWEINPYDEFALEEALRLKDAKIAKSVTVFSVGAKASEAKIREALARGASGAVRIDTAGLEGADSLVLARVLAAAAQKHGIDLLLCGKQAVDTDNGQVPPMMAEILGWPQVLVISKLEISGTAVRAWRTAGGGASEVVETTLPAVISADKGLNEPRYAKLKGIMMAKRKKIPVETAAGLGVSDTAGSVTLSNWSPPPQRPAGRMIDGDVDTQVSELVRLLRDEAKVL